jgi:hypothetical protein
MAGAGSHGAAAAADASAAAAAAAADVDNWGSVCSGEDAVTLDAWSDVKLSEDVVSIRAEKGGEKQGFCSRRATLVQILRNSVEYGWNPVTKTEDKSVRYYRHTEGFLLDQAGLNMIERTTPRKYSLFQMKYVGMQPRPNGDRVAVYTLRRLASDAEYVRQIRHGQITSYRRQSYARLATEREAFEKESARLLEQRNEHLRRDRELDAERRDRAQRLLAKAQHVRDDRPEAVVRGFQLAPASLLVIGRPISYGDLLKMDAATRALHQFVLVGSVEESGLRRVVRVLSVQENNKRVVFESGGFVLQYEWDAPRAQWRNLGIVWDATGRRWLENGQVTTLADMYANLWQSDSPANAAPRPLLKARPLSERKSPGRSHSPRVRNVPRLAPSVRNRHIPVLVRSSSRSLSRSPSASVSSLSPISSPARLFPGGARGKDRSPLTSLRHGGPAVKPPASGPGAGLGAVPGAGPAPASAAAARQEPIPVHSKPRLLQIMRLRNAARLRRLIEQPVRVRHREGGVVMQTRFDGWLAGFDAKTDMLTLQTSNKSSHNFRYNADSDDWSRYGEHFQIYLL